MAPSSTTDRGILTVHWARLGAGPGDLGGQLLALWPAPVQHDRCFEAAGFTEFSDGGDAWDRDHERLIGALLAALGAHGDPCVRGPARVEQPRLLDRLRGKRAEVATPLLELLRACFDDNAPCRVSFGAPARAFVQRSDGHEILWIWLSDELAATWPALLALVAGDVPVRNTELAWEHLLPEEFLST